MSEKTMRSVEISVTAVFVLALLLVGAVLIFSGGLATAKQIATLDIFGGKVEVQHGNGTFAPAEEGQSLREGDTVRTGSGGRASIEYFDGSVTRLDFETSFTVISLETLDNAAGSTVIKGEQIQGNSYNRVVELTDAASRFEVETPTATTSVRGTVYAIIVSPVDGSTTIAVIEGAIVAITDEGEVEVPAGKMVVIGADGSLGEIVDIPSELLESDWITFNQCELDDEAGCVLTEGVSPEPSEGDPKDEQQETEGSPPGGGGGDGVDGDGDGGDDEVDPGDEPPPPPALNQPPHAGFTAHPMVGPAPLSVDFEDESSDPDGDAITRFWTFGDGATQSGGLSPSHTYPEPGAYTVTLLVTDPEGETDARSRTILVEPAVVFDHIVISPSSATIQPGGSQAYTAEAFDTDGNSMGNVTSSTSFTIAPDGSCSANSCTATQPGAHTVTGMYSGDSDTATLTVEAPPACPGYAISFHTRPPASVQAGHQFNVQVKVDVLEGGSANGPLDISLSLGGGSFSGGQTSLTWTGQGTLTFNHLTIDQPGSYTITATAACATPTDASPITITEAPGPGTPGVVGLVLSLPALGLLRRRR